MQRLSGLDASFLYFETRSQLLHVCGLIVLDTSSMEGGYSFQALRAELERRVAAMPGFRRMLHDSMINLDHPVWVEAENFDIDHHLHRIGLPEPGSDVELAELCAHLAGQPMDRSMPLWEMFVIEGLPDDQVAVFAKMHHCTVDGVSGANMMSQLCTLTPDDPSLDEELVEENAGGSGALELAVGGALSRLAMPWRLASLLPGTLRVLPSWINRARKGLAMPAPFTAPRTPFNRNITGHRTISFASVPLADVKKVKNAFDCTVNDVVLAVCADALRRYLEDLGELPGKPLIAMVPMSVHSAEHRPGTNRVSGMFMSLATDVDDRVERLLEIRDANVVAKDHNQALDANLLTDWAQFAAPSVFGSAVRMYSRLRLSERHPVVHNLVISNVPGPNFPIYFLGARIEKMLPLGPIFHGAGLNCTVMSLDGQLHIGFIGCKELVPDAWPLADHVVEALADYVDEADSRGSGSGSGGSGQKVIASSSSGRTAPAKKAPATKSSAKKVAAKKAPAKKAAAKKAPAKKAAARKATAKKSSALRSAAKKSSATKTAAKKAPAKKSAATKAPAKKAAATKAAPAKASATKATATKPVAQKPVATASATTANATKSDATTAPATSNSTSTAVPAATGSNGSAPAAASTSGSGSSQSTAPQSTGSASTTTAKATSDTAQARGA